MDCLFCNIAAGKIPAKIVYESDKVVAFEDIAPQAPTHLLIIPKQHIATLDDLEDPALAGHILLTAKKLAAERGLTNDGYRTVINCNTDGGQVVFHLHCHLLGGRKMTWPPG